jgi:hypothetical protein
MPNKSPFYWLRFKSKLNPSIIRMRRNNDNGQPYLSPLPLLKKSEDTPLMRIVKVANEMHPIIQFVMGTKATLEQDHPKEIPTYAIVCFLEINFEN